MSKEETITVTVANEYGLHSRPAAMIVKSIRSLDCNVRFASEMAEANAKNILEIMTMAATHGTAITINAQGNEADLAIGKLKELFEAKFNEA